MGIERIRYTANGTRKTIILDILQERYMPQLQGTVLIGHELTREGDTVGRMHLMDRAVIVKRAPMVMNTHYGELEVAR